MGRQKTVRQVDLQSSKYGTGRKEDFPSNVDPKYVGPGTWNTIHSLAFSAVTPKKKKKFISTMKEICETFPCAVCANHCVEYVKSHPMEDYADTWVEIDGSRSPLGLFVWSWKFHNAVNRRIGKPMMSWITAYNMYLGEGALSCDNSCAA